MNLDDLLDMIAGREKWSGLGKRLHTYPNYDDKNQDELYEKCCVLEIQEKVKRTVDGPDYVCWEII